MNPITFTLEPGMQGPEVADLHEALFVLLARAAVLRDDEAIRRELADRLREERAQNIYTDGTRAILEYFQSERGLDAQGIVDEPTANALNALLREWGLLAQEQAPRAYVVSGRVTRADGAPARSAALRAFHDDERGAAVRLGDDSADGDGNYTIRYELLPEVAAIRLRVVVLGEDGRPLQSSEPIAAARPLEIVNLVLPAAPEARPQRTLDGRVVLEHGLPAEGLTLRLYRREVGCGATPLAETTTGAGGAYSFAYEVGRAASLEVRAVDAAGNETTLSKPLNFLGAQAARATVNLAAPSALQPPAAEYTRLAADLTAQVGAMAQLTAVQENARCQDLTVLNRATGWDARLIALAATTERLSAEPDVALPQEALYGLLRAGLPFDKFQLAQLDADAAAQVLTRVRDAGLVALDDDAIGRFKDDFTEFKGRVRLSLPMPGSAESYGTMLRASGLDETAQNEFARAYFKPRAGNVRLLDAAQEAGLGEPEIVKLQLQGKLAFLAGNSAPMTAHLAQKLAQQNSDDPALLVEEDLYDAANWKAEIEGLAAGDAAVLAALIPAAYTGTPEERLDAYAAEMARKVRLSYPTQVLARKVEVNDADPFRLGDARGDTARLLKSAAAQGFRLGRTPVEAFFRQAEARDAAGGVEPVADAAVPGVARQQIKQLQRTYQITLNDAGMEVLAALELRSAHDVTALAEAEFVARYDSKYFDLFGKHPPKQEGPRIHRKARQVISFTYNLFTVAKTLESTPAVRGFSAPAAQAGRREQLNGLLKHYPTLEQLFGSQDFCDCEHCRSVLSPAAYLVDLLQFIDANAGVEQNWATFLAHWEQNHDGGKYPHKDADGQPMTPYDVLIERRPDLPHIPLTCENTNTALPYIDIVNEILEYYVANDRLAADAARDTGDAADAELLAEPQNVIRAAYDRVLEAHYPPALPFDLWLETVRQFCTYFETPAARLLDLLRPTDSLFDSGQPYDRSAVFAESLGLSPAEWGIFTDRDPLAGDEWIELYGYLPVSTAVHDPANAINATLAVADADAARLSTGLPCTYFDVDAGALHTETKFIKEIGGPGSGGPGLTTVTFTGVWDMPPAADDLLTPDAPAALQSAKALARRLGVTYKEIVEIVRTGFVNPELERLTLLYKLGIPIHSVLLWRDAANQAFFAANRDLLDVERADLAAADQGRFDALTVDDRQKIQEMQAHRGLLLWWDPESREFYAGNRDLLDRRRDGLSPADQARFDALTADDWQRLRAMRPHEGRAQEFARFGLKADDLAAALEAMPFAEILVLADPDAGCNFDETTLRYADGRRADALAFLRINLFVRLWRKLGWSIEETDHALQAFVPGGAALTAANLGDAPLATALVYLAHLKTLSERVRVGKQSRLKLVTLWADIPTTGKNSLYAQLFLTRTVLKDDDVFDHPWGLYLGPAWIAQQAATRSHAVELAGVAAALDPAPFAARPDLAERLALHYDSLQETQHLAYTGILSDDDKAALLALAPSDALAQLLDAVQAKAREFSLVKGHLLALQGALGLGADEVRRILADDGKDLETESLSLPAVSLLYRYGLLAKALQLSVPDLITLKALSDRNPFTPLHPAPLQTMGEDHPYTQTLAFADVADAVKGSGLTVADLDYLLRHRFDPTGPLRPNREAALALLKTLAAGVQAIRAEHAVPADPGALADETLHQKLGLALPPDVAARFVAMLDGKVEFAANQAQMKAFFDEHLLKQAGKPPTTGFLAAGDFALLFDPQYGFEGEDIGDQEKARRRRAALVHAFLPYLQDRLVRQFIVQAIIADAGASAGAEPALVESLLTDARLLATPGGGALLEALAALGARGVSAAFDGAGAVTVAEANAALKPVGGAADAARFAGYLEVPAPGAYRFMVHLGQPNAPAELRFDHLPDPLWLARKAADPPNDVLGQGDAEFLELKAGVLYRFSLDVAGLNGQGTRLEVQGETLPQGGLGQLALYPAETLDAAERALLLLQKALRLLQALGLNEREARHLLTHPADFGGVNLGQLPTTADAGAPADLAAAVVRFAAFLRLAAYAHLQREMAGGTDGLIGVFEAAAVAAAEEDAAARLAKMDQVYARIGDLVRRDLAAVKAAARALAAQPAFPNEEPLQRLWDLLQVVERFGVPVAALLRWVRIVNPAATPEQRFAIARDLRAAIKARFEPEAWQRVARPIFDALRRRQRDALVAYIVHRRGFAGMEELYEFFLIDPGTEPVVQTSRIRLAIASVQLFIQRCLLNLEANVHPSAILNAGQWEWMKRYRVWEANRKIFLFPENWLEPEFRDDKTHLFAELEGALLQGDVSQDLAEDAFYTYLKKLEEMARLDVVAMHLEEGVMPADNTLHVIGRTHEQPHKYFYRRYADSMWTPWEPVSAEIEGDHLAPVVWRDRLYLFWVTFLEKPLPGETPEIDVNNPISIAGPTKDVEAHLHWSEYLHGEWSAPASSDVTKPSPVRFAGLSSFDSSKLFVHVVRESAPGAEEEGGVFIHLSGTATRPPPKPTIFSELGDRRAKADGVSQVYRPIFALPGSGTSDRTETIEGAFYLAGRNSPPEGSYYAAQPAIPYGLTNRGATRYRGSGALKVTYKQRITTEPGKTPKPETQDILRKKGGAYSLLACNNEITLGAPTLAQLAGADNPAAVKKAIEDGLAEIAALMKPVFYQDNLRTLFIEPNVVERTVEEWQEWITPTPQPGVSVPEWLLDDDLFKEHVGPKYVFTPPGPDDYFDPFSPAINYAESVAKVRPGTDWLVNGATALLFDGQVIGPHGGVEVALLPASQAAGAVAQGGAPLSVHPGSSVAADQVAVAAGATALTASGLAAAPGGLNLIGGDGFNAALQQNFSAFNASNLGPLAHAGSRFGG